MREPVFLVGKDFVNGLNVRKGVCGQGGNVRPFDVGHGSGIVPKVKINYTEVGIFSGLPKDSAKNGCELIFKDMAEKVKKGLAISLPIPHVGTFRCRANLAAV